MGQREEGSVGMAIVPWAQALPAGDWPSQYPLLYLFFLSLPSLSSFVLPLLTPLTLFSFSFLSFSFQGESEGVVNIHQTGFN